jgi:hypothetical protein
MSKFKVGDRVRVFEGKRTYEGRIESVGSGSTGQRIRVQFDRDRDSDWFYAQQCRKLVKRERREWWICPRDGGAVYHTKPEGLYHSDVIHVREVRLKK